MPITDTRKVFTPIVRQTGLLCSLALLSGVATASPEISGGVWFNYNYQFDGDKESTDKAKNSLGDIGDEALILYVDSQESESPWSYSAELRIGPGSFTDPDNNSTGSSYGLKKAWLAYQVDAASSLIIGKSQLPFGWKTGNFWPGDILIGGYGDQMDVGVKWTSQYQQVDYNLAYFHADDWGSTSTDTMDDNGHWGSSTTYRKVQTFVADASSEVAAGHRIGASAQYGKLQDLTGIDATNPVDGSHSAAVIYYKGQIDKFFVNAQAIRTRRDLPDNYWKNNDVEDRIENDRYAIEVGYATGKWTYYIDASWAHARTDGNSAGTVGAYAPGMKYHYGPGWLYAEVLMQDGYIDRNGQVHEGDFGSLYLTLDYYF